MLASWLPLAVFALVVWSVQRVVTKVALFRWSTARFYRLNAILSLAVYTVFAIAVHQLLRTAFSMESNGSHCGSLAECTSI